MGIFKGKRIYRLIFVTQINKISVNSIFSRSNNRVNYVVHPAFRRDCILYQSAMVHPL